MDNREKLEYCRDALMAIRDDYLEKSIILVKLDEKVAKAFFNHAQWLSEVLRDTKPKSAKRKQTP